MTKRFTGGVVKHFTVRFTEEETEYLDLISNEKGISKNKILHEMLLLSLAVDKEMLTCWEMNEKAIASGNEEHVKKLTMLFNLLEKCKSSKMKIERGEGRKLIIVNEAFKKNSKDVLKKAALFEKIPLVAGDYEG